MKLIDRFKTKNGLTEATSDYDKAVEGLMAELEVELSIHGKGVRLNAHNRDTENNEVIIDWTISGTRIGVLKAAFKIENKVVHTGFNLKAKTFVAKLIPISGAFTQKEVVEILKKVEDQFSESAEKYD